MQTLLNYKYVKLRQRKAYETKTLHIVCYVDTCCTGDQVSSISFVKYRDQVSSISFVKYQFPTLTSKIRNKTHLF